MASVRLVTFLGATALIVLSCLHFSYGDLEPVLHRCCQSGEAWSRNHTSCTGPPQVTSASAQDRLACLTSVYICCIRSHRRIACERGKEAAKEGRQCGTTDDDFRDCCDGCSLGMQAGVARMPCNFLRFSFGAPWDEAYIDCCERSSSAGVSHQTSKATCEPNSPCSQLCEVVENRVKCSCYPGFRLSVDQATCEDIDECQLNTHTCNPATEVCSNLVGGFKCLSSQVADCPNGLIKNQQTQACEDFDECTLQPCSRNDDCVNTFGSYRCQPKTPSNRAACPPGFVYNENSGSCIDVDECQDDIHLCNRTTEICQNSHGGFQCIPKPVRSKDCPAGFKWNDARGECEDVDECLEDLHDCDIDKKCRNTVGGYECEPKCFRLMKFDPVQDTCVESNACVDGLHNCKSNEVCISIPDGSAGFLCIPNSGNTICPPGFKPVSDSRECEDINECEEFPDGVCDTERETCINGVGSYDCIPNPPPQSQVQSCPLGFQRDEERRQCIDINECLEGLDRCNRTTQDCVNRNGTHDCVAKAANNPANTCPPGYRVSSGPGTCEDINECTEGKHKCLRDKEQCVNVPGAYRCQPVTAQLPCPPGHRFDGFSSGGCKDIDECQEESHACNLNTQNCVNAVGSYRCVQKANCPHGYRLAGNKCQDVDECAEYAHDCDRRTQYCVNTEGSYQCQTKLVQPASCGTGFIFDPRRNECADVDECEVLQPCGNDQECENTVGSYKCNCSPGFTHDVFSRRCKDVNECQLSLHSCEESQRCDNTIGSYTCVRITSCGTGYTLNAGLSQCEDDDECVLGTHNCGPGFSCRNLQGSFRCDRVTCPPGQKLLSDGSCKVIVCGRGMEPDDAGNCIDINECSRPSVCRANQRCINTVGSYRCQNLLNCPAGYELNEFGDQCIDVDECARRIYECGAQQTCRNRPGGYTCECPRGYAINLQRECEDIDECTRFRGQVCSRMSECINTQGSYVCNCKDGFRKADDDKNCVDIDECAEIPNICHQVCNNVWGAYQCSCQSGFTLSAADNRSCEDIDECKRYEGHGDLCIGYCVNEPGSFSCSCPSGYRLGSDKRTCQDIDECQEQNVCSGDRQVCLNTRGGYKCNPIVCPPNYVRDKDHRNERVNNEDTVVCRKRCPPTDVDCVLEGPQTVTYQTLALPSVPYLPRPLILTTMRAVTTRNSDATFRTDFLIEEGNEGGIFDILKGQGVGSLRLAKAIRGPRELLLKILMTIQMNPSAHNRYAAISRHVAVIDVIVSQHEF